MASVCMHSNEDMIYFHLHFRVCYILFLTARIYKLSRVNRFKLLCHASIYTIQQNPAASVVRKNHLYMCAG